MTLQRILDDCGLIISGYAPVHGGDINQSFCLFTAAEKYFLKVNDADLYPQMFHKEADGLGALANEFAKEKDPALIKIPKVIKHGNAGGSQYLLLEWLEKGNPSHESWESFGAGIAALHKRQQPFFGWQEDNYIGSLKQTNTRCGTWHEFYAECRIAPLVKKLFDLKCFSKQDIDSAASFCKELKQLFPTEPPALLHGDLWSGNFMITSRGMGSIYDPAVYYGHREMDIGMSKLFGGFDPCFYDAYDRVYPLEKNWQQRVILTQVYPLLVHAVLFGGQYISNARSILNRFA